MECPICSNTEKWKNVDHLRDDDDKTFKEKVDGKEVVKKINMCLCEVCGFVGYPDKQDDEAKIKAYYKSEYRSHKPPGYNNYATCKRKVTYHQTFLKDLFTEWKKEHPQQGEGLKITEIGAAFGMALSYFKSEFPKAEIQGTEWTDKYKRVAWNEFGIKLDDDFDNTKKYDLIMSYKVLEHQTDPHLKLREYAECLGEGGRLYISVPTWFNVLSNFGLQGFDLKYYYHTDHINVWTSHLFEQLLKKCGLEIVKEDHFMYGDTYLCKRNDELMKTPFEPEKEGQIEKAMGLVKKSFECLKKQDPDGALKHYANNPAAWAAYYEKNRQKLHADNFDELYEKVCTPYLKFNNRGRDSLIFAADLCMRYEDYMRAVELLEEVNEKVPNNGRPMLALGHCFRNLSFREMDPERKIKLLQAAHGISVHVSGIDPDLIKEAYTWRYKDASEIPTPFELMELNKQAEEPQQPQEGQCQKTQQQQPKKLQPLQQKSKLKTV